MFAQGTLFESRKIQGVVSLGGTPPNNLTFSHIRPDEGKPRPSGFSFRIAEGASCTKMVEHLKQCPRPHQGGRRGIITRFSSSSRMRMLQRLNSIQRDEVRQVMFLTLTVPSQDKCSFKEIGRHLSAMLKRMHRHWRGKNFSVIWKKEPHKSGWPHLHLLIFWMSEAPAVEPDSRGRVDHGDVFDWIREAWADVVKSVHTKHEERGINLQVMQKWEGVISYTGKYLAKMNDAEGDPIKTAESDGVGRIWGVDNAAGLPVKFSDRVTSSRTGKRVRRILRKLQQRKRARLMFKAPGSGWVFIPEHVRGELKSSMALNQARARQYGWKEKVFVPQCGVTRVTPVWVEVEETTSRGVRRWREMADESVERHMFTSHVSFAKSADVTRLIDHFERLEKWEDEHRVPW